LKTLAFDVRTEAGTTAARAVRRAGKIPGVLYGHGLPTAISLSAKDLEELLTTSGKSRIVDATIDGEHDSVMLREVARHPVSHRPIHADFQRVSKGEAISATIPIVITGTSEAVKDGAVLDIVTRTIDVKGPADKIPEQLTIDVTEMTVHTHLSAAELVLPAGFTLVTPADAVIISIEASRTAALVEEAAGETPPSEAPVTEAATTVSG
jgi:large subunit ribosomal protein L25